jgi:TonB family protein
MTPKRNFFVWALGLLVSLAGARAALPQHRDQASQEESYDSAAQKSAAATDDPAAGHAYASGGGYIIGDAVCPIVYQVDRGVPSPRGYRYLFYGNGFFINSDGYLLTAAHVLSQLHGGQAYLLLREAAGKPRFVQADVMAIDRDHDIAILRATPNPFAGNDAVSFLPLASEAATPGEMVQAADLRPSKPRDAYSLDQVLDERSPGEVMRFEFSKLEKGAADTELFLFNHAIRPGQSGAPVIASDSQEVAGLVEGQWLRDDISGIAALKDDPVSGDVAASSPAARDVAPILGAVVPIHYAIALLQQKGIAWHTASDGARTHGEGEVSAPPVPLSLVPAPYPSESLFGGEVVLDALVDRNGTVSDVKVVDGDQPFLRKALDSVHTWTFFPARSGGQSAEERIAIVFQFPQPYVPPRSPTVHHYDEDSSSVTGIGVTEDGVDLPVTTVEPEYPAGSDAGGSVILYESIDKDGRVASVETVSGVEPLTTSVVGAAEEWRFAPASKLGAGEDSAAIIVVTFRHPLATSRVPK